MECSEIEELYKSINTEKLVTCDEFVAGVFNIEPAKSHSMCSAFGKVMSFHGAQEDMRQQLLDQLEPLLDPATHKLQYRLGDAVYKFSGNSSFRHNARFTVQQWLESLDREAPPKARSKRLMYQAFSLSVLAAFLAVAFQLALARIVSVTSLSSHFLAFIALFAMSFILIYGLYQVLDSIKIRRFYPEVDKTNVQEMIAAVATSSSCCFGETASKAIAIAESHLAEEKTKQILQLNLAKFNALTETIEDLRKQIRDLTKQLGEKDLVIDSLDPSKIELVEDLSLKQLCEAFKQHRAAISAGVDSLLRVISRDRSKDDSLAQIWNSDRESDFISELVEDDIKHHDIDVKDRPNAANSFASIVSAKQLGSIKELAARSFVKQRSAIR